MNSFKIITLLDQWSLTAPGPRAAHGVDALDEVSFPDEVEDLRGHASHNAHTQQHVVRVGQLDPVLAEGGAEWTHAERQDVHHATCTNDHTNSQCPVCQPLTSDHHFHWLVTQHLVRSDVW